MTKMCKKKYKPWVDKYCRFIYTIVIGMFICVLTLEFLKK